MESLYYVRALPFALGSSRKRASRLKDGLRWGRYQRDMNWRFIIGWVSLAVACDCSPREIFSKHLDEAKSLWRMPGDPRYTDLDELRKALGSKPVRRAWR